MTKQFSMRNLIAIALMLFSLFFGAGNLIFPPMVGKLAGTGLLPAMLFFAITAVILPVLGMMAVAKTKGLTNLGNRVGNTFSLVFIILVYMSIGPFLAIPRAGSVPFEMAIAPYLPGSFSRPLALAIYTVVFFAFACAISVMNSKSVEKIMGDILTPVLLAMLILLFAASLFKNMPAYGMPIGEYALNPLSKAFIDGYLTMDTLAALNFGLVISVAIEAYGITDEKKSFRYKHKNKPFSRYYFIFNLPYACRHRCKKCRIISRYNKRRSNISARFKLPVRQIWSDYPCAYFYSCLFNHMRRFARFNKPLFFNFGTEHILP